MAEAFSEDHKRAGLLLVVMMKHNQINTRELAQLMGVGENTITAYRIGKSTIPYERMNQLIEILQPSQVMRLNFESACQMANHMAWKLAGNAPQTKYTGKKKNG